MITQQQRALTDFATTETQPNGHYTVEMALQNLLDTVSSCVELSDSIKTKLYGVNKERVAEKCGNVQVLCVEGTIRLILEKAAEVQTTLAAVNVRL